MIHDSLHALTPLIHPLYAFKIRRLFNYIQYALLRECSGLTMLPELSTVEGQHMGLEQIIELNYYHQL